MAVVGLRPPASVLVAMVAKPPAQRGVAVSAAIAGRAWKKPRTQATVSATPPAADTGSKRLPSVVGREMAAEGAIAAPLIGRAAVRAVGIDSSVAQLVTRLCARHRSAPAILAGGQRVVVAAIPFWTTAALRRTAKTVMATQASVPP